MNYISIDLKKNFDFVICNTWRLPFNNKLHLAKKVTQVPSTFSTFHPGGLDIAGDRWLISNESVSLKNFLKMSNENSI